MFRILNSKSKLAAAALVAGLAVSATATASEKGQKFIAPLPNSVQVSDRDFNHFIFPKAVTQLVFPGGSPVAGEPIYMSDNKQVLVQLKSGYDKPVQMVVETEDGQVFKMYLIPKPINGVTHRAGDPRQERIEQMTKSGVNPYAKSEVVPSGAEIEIMKQVATGVAPDGFEPIALPKPTVFDKFTAVPLAGWTDSYRKVMIFNLVAAEGQSAVVAPNQFYRPGITSVMIDGDVVDAKNSPVLYVIEELPNE